MSGEKIELLKRRLDREKRIRQQAEQIAEEKSRELYVKGIALAKALEAESRARAELETLYREVERLSRIDPLTQVSNRRSFSADAARLCQLAVRHHRTLSCAVLDVDDFKRVNDTYGHDAGDQVLIAVAQACQKEIRQTDLLARFGGEEFSFIFPETELGGARQLAERVRQAIARLQFGQTGRRFSVTASIGVSAMREPGDTLDDLLKRGDAALYAAKQGGRNQVVARE